MERINMIYYFINISKDQEIEFWKNQTKKLQKQNTEAFELANKIFNLYKQYVKKAQNQRKEINNLKQKLEKQKERLIKCLEKQKRK